MAIESYDPSTDRFGCAVIGIVFVSVVYAYATNFSSVADPLMDCTTERWQEHESARGTMPTPDDEERYRRECLAMVRGGK